MFIILLIFLLSNFAVAQTKGDNKKKFILSKDRINNNRKERENNLTG
jgi:hypothetical protein